MRVRILSAWAGHNFSYAYGDVVDVDDKIAKDRIKAGLAEEVSAKTPVGSPLNADHVAQLAELRDAVGALHDKHVALVEDHARLAEEHAALAKSHGELIAALGDAAPKPPAGKEAEGGGKAG